MAASEVEGEFYHRPVDRSVEKGDFFHLPQQDRVLISQLRNATEGFRVKMTGMRDTLDDKELDLGREAALRKAAEERLDQLVDMYGDPAVNAELKERLPRARSRETRAELQHKIDEISKKGHSILTNSNPALNIEDLDTEAIASNSRHARSKSADSLDGPVSRRRASTYDSANSEEVTTRRRQRSHSPPGSHTGVHSRHTAGPYPPHPAYSYPPYPSPPYPGYHPSYYSYPPPPHPHPHPPMMYASPMQMSYMQPAPSVNNPGVVMTPTVGGMNPSIPVAQSTPVHGSHGVVTQMNTPPAQTSAVNMTSGYGSYYPVSYLASSTLSGHGDANYAAAAGLVPAPSGMTVIGTPAPSSAGIVNQSGVQFPSTGLLHHPPGTTVLTSGNPGNHPNVVAPSGVVTGHNIPHPDGSDLNQTSQTGLEGVTPIQSMRLARLQNTSPPNSSVGATAAKDLSVSREQNRQIALLLKELDAARELNKKLQAQLAQVEQELESLKMQLKTQDASHRAEISAKAAELVEEIYRAQKQRDEAMMGRLKLANEERDEVLLKLKRNDRGLDELEETEIDKDAGLHQLLSTLDSSGAPSQLSHYGNVLADAIRNMSDRKKKMTTEEMKAVLEERDTMLVKCRHLEGELLKLQRQNRARVPDQQQQASMQAKLLATQQERDMALNKIRKQEEELQTLRVYYSLHKSLSQEEHLRDQYNNQLGSIEGELKQRDSTIHIANKENSNLVAQIKSLLAEKNQISDQLSTANSSLKHEQEKSDKLERLVNVLRRKLTGMGTKIDD